SKRGLHQLIFIESFCDIDQRLQSETDRTGLVVFPVLFPDEWPCDIQMCPRRTFGHELLEEQSRGERARDGPSDVVQIRIGRLEQFPVLFRQRQFPERLALILSGSNNGL